ncbi:MAG TPA: hypothetical protein VKQ11_01410 [Candidatus Sulfotelmatobacter sp.]|nr:hypothetical protein [Candidatus Sulfotelmatobacter sp.]
MDTKNRSIAKIIVTTVCVIAALWIVCCGALYGVMRRPPERFGQFMAKIPAPVAFLVLPFETLWMHARAGTLQAGDQAPDFTLATLDKSGHVQLSSFIAQGRPVVLIFGSYT